MATDGSYGSANVPGPYPAEVKAQKQAEAEANIKALQEQQMKAEQAAQQLAAQKAEAAKITAQLQTQTALRDESGIAGMQKRVEQVGKIEAYKGQVETAMKQVTAQKAEIEAARAEQQKSSEYWAAARPVFTQVGERTGEGLFIGYAATPEEAKGVEGAYWEQQWKAEPANIIGSSGGTFVNPYNPETYKVVPGATLPKSVEYVKATGRLEIPFISGGATPPEYKTESVITKVTPTVTQQYVPPIYSPLGIEMAVEKGIKKGTEFLISQTAMGVPGGGGLKAIPSKKVGEIAGEAANIGSWFIPYVRGARAGLFVGGIAQKQIVGEKVSPIEWIGFGTILASETYSILKGMERAAVISQAAKTPLEIKGISVDVKGKSYLVLKGIKQIGGEPVLADIKVPMKITPEGYETLKGGTTVVSYVSKKGELVMKSYKIPAGIQGTVEPEAIWKEISKKGAETITKVVKPLAEQKVVVGESQLQPAYMATLKKTGILKAGGEVEVMAGKITPLEEPTQKSMTISLFKSIEKQLPSGETREYVAFKGAELEKIKTISIGTDEGMSLFKTLTGGEYPVMGAYRPIKITPPSEAIDVGGFTVSKIAEGVTIIPKKIGVAEIAKTEQTQRIIGSAAVSLGVSASKKMAELVAPSTKSALSSLKMSESLLSVIKTAPQVKVIQPSKQMPIQRTIPIAKVTPSEIQIPRQREITLQRVSPSVRQVPAIREIVLQKDVVIQRLAQKQIELQKEIQSQKSVQKEVFPSITATTIPTPLMKIPPGFGQVIKTPKEMGTISTAFKLFVKRYGKYKEIPGLFARGEAIRKGEEITLKTLARSFKIAATKGYIKNIGLEEYQPQPLKFRTYKIRKGKRIPLKEEWIQKAKYSLGSMGERREIQAARRKKKWY